MFSPEELAEMSRFATALRFTFRPDGTPLKESGAGAKIAGHALNAIAASLGFKVAGPTGAGAALTATRFGRNILTEALPGRKAQQFFEGGAPRAAAASPAIDPRLVGVGSGLVLQEAR